MEYYAGDEEGLPTTHFRWLANSSDQGGETENFHDLDGICYGYCAFHTSTNLQNLGAKAYDGSLSDALVVFTATSPRKGDGARIVGWYENATLYRDSIARPIGTRSPAKAITSSKDAYLLSEADRTFQVPRMREGYPGMSPLAYLSKLNPAFDADVVAYINQQRQAGRQPIAITKPRNILINRRFQSDPLLRSKVEKAAVDRVKAFYGEVPDPTKSREADNIGWDLETESGKRIEVKGRFSYVFDAELTPNEYKAFTGAMTDAKLAESYRLAIVANALSPDGGDLSIFRFRDGRWKCEITERILAFEERPGAKVGLSGQ